MFPYLPERTQVTDKGISAMPEWNRSYANFRLNFEQQGKRAKDLLKAARAGEPAVAMICNSHCPKRVSKGITMLISIPI